MNIYRRNSFRAWFEDVRVLLLGVVLLSAGSVLILALLSSRSLLFD